MKHDGPSTMCLAADAVSPGVVCEVVVCPGIAAVSTGTVCGEVMVCPGIKTVSLLSSA